MPPPSAYCYLVPPPFPGKGGFFAWQKGCRFLLKREYEIRKACFLKNRLATGEEGVV